jgi:hypothetical protein
MTIRSEVVKAMNMLEAKTGRDTFSPREIIRQVQSQTSGLHEASLRTHITSWGCANTETGHGGLYPDLFKVDRGLYRLNTRQFKGARKELKSTTVLKSANVTCRDEILQAMKILSQKSRRDAFTPKEIIRQVLTQTKAYGPSTIRTDIVSRMCVDAPVHHAKVYQDLVRVSRGYYRLA